MSTKDQAWAERVGREAVELGMPKTLGLAWMGSSGSGRLHPCDMPADDEVWPDFCDRLTELACIAWVEDVAREVYEERELAIEFGWEFGPVEYVKIYVWLGGEDMTGACRAPTLAEACIAAVRAMKGGE